MIYGLKANHADPVHLVIVPDAVSSAHP
jgi:hypothetical protein